MSKRWTPKVSVNQFKRAVILGFVRGACCLCAFPRQHELQNSAELFIDQLYITPFKHIMNKSIISMV